MQHTTFFGILSALVLTTTVVFAGDHDCYSKSVHADNPDRARASQCKKPLTENSNCKVNADYWIDLDRTQSNATVFAIHGGDIEFNTHIVASRLADRGNWNYYAFVANGSRQCLNGRSASDVLSIKAVDYYEDDLVDLLKKSKHSVMIGGYADSRLPSNVGEIVCVGGKNGAQIDRFARELDRLTQDDSDFEGDNTKSEGYETKSQPTRGVRIHATRAMYSDTPAANDPSETARRRACDGLAGQDSDSIVNKNAQKSGLQLYFSKSMRDQLAKADTDAAKHYLNVLASALRAAFSD